MERTETLSKRQERQERKKKKIRALLEVTELNEEDRRQRHENQDDKLQKIVAESEDTSTDGSISATRNSQVSKRKKKQTQVELPAKKRKHKTNKEELVMKSESTAILSLQNSMSSTDHSVIKPAIVSGTHDSTSSDQSNRLQRLPSDEFAILKALLKEKEKLKLQKPLLYLRDCGLSAALSFNEGKRTPLFLSDIQALLLVALQGGGAPYRPRWCTLHRWTKVSHVVSIVAEGVSCSDIEQLTAASELFPHQVEVISPLQYGMTPTEELVNVPLSVNQKCRFIKELGSLEAAVQKGKTYKAFRSIFPIKKDEEVGIISEGSKEEGETERKFGHLDLLLSVTQMADERFPLPMAGLSNAEYELTKQEYREASVSSPLYCLDCEMCMTVRGEHELTRISVVNEHLELVYHALVKPTHKIINYLTEYSGITKTMLDGVTTKLSDVQEQLRLLLPANAILVGHSLSNDLKVLKLMHPYVIDTSVIYNLTGERRRKTKLSVLSHLFLQQSIQTNKGGHSPTEDAIATMKLVLLKLKHGYSYGDAILGGQVPTLTDSDRVPTIGESGEGPVINNTGYVTNLFSTISKAERKATVIGVADSLEEYRCQAAKVPSRPFTVLEVKNNKQVVEQGCQQAISHDFTLLHLDLRDRLGANIEKEKHQRHLHKLDKRISRLYAAVAPRSLVVVIMGGRDETGDVLDPTNGACLVCIKP